MGGFISNCLSKLPFGRAPAAGAASPKVGDGSNEPLLGNKEVASTAPGESRVPTNNTSLWARAKNLLTQTVEVVAARFRRLAVNNRQASTPKPTSVPALASASSAVPAAESAPASASSAAPAAALPQFKGAVADMKHLRKLIAEGADLSQADLTGLRFQNKAEVEQAVAAGANLKGAHLENLDLQEAQLKGAHLEGAHLEGALLQDAHLEEAHLENANLSGAQLHRAHLEGAHLEGANLTSARLLKAHLEGAFAKGAILGDARMQEAHLEGAHLEEADLQKANLGEANLQGAFLENAKIKGAILVSTDLRGADLRGVDLTTAPFQVGVLTGAAVPGKGSLEASAGPAGVNHSGP